MLKSLNNIERKAKWKLEMDTSEMVRNAVIEYLDKHLPEGEKKSLHLRKYYR